MSGLRTVIGLHACAEVLKVRPKAIREVWLRGDHERVAALKPWLQFSQRQRVLLKVQSAKTLDALGSGHQGLAVIVDGGPELDWSALKTAPKAIIVALDQVEDPHNVGALLRTAWLVGAHGLLVPDRRSAHMTATVAKVASGGAEHVPLEVVDNLAQALTDLKDSGFWIFGLAHDADQNLWQMRLPDKVVWVLGSEEAGMRSTTEKQCDERVQLFQTESTASYNVAVAGGMALSETLRQWNSVKSQGNNL
jgi:23S rRNA (guanosine2251-2'-O)-methyltransferase